MKQASPRKAWLLAVGFLVVAIVQTLVTVVESPPYNPIISTGIASGLGSQNLIVITKLSMC